MMTIVCGRCNRYWRDACGRYNCFLEELLGARRNATGSSVNPEAGAFSFHLRGSLDECYSPGARTKTPRPKPSACRNASSATGLRNLQFVMALSDIAWSWGGRRLTPPEVSTSPCSKSGTCCPSTANRAFAVFCLLANFQVGVNPVSTNDLLHALSDKGLSPVALPWHPRKRLLLLSGLGDIRALRGFATQGAVALRRCP